MSVFLATGFTGNTYGLKSPRFCWNWFRDGIVSATTEADGFPAINALPPRTDNSWRPTVLPATWTITYPFERDVSFVGIARHDLGTLNATIAIEYFDGSVWTAFPGASAIQPEDDSALLFLCEETTCEAVRVTVSSADDEPTITVIMVGLADEWPQPVTWPGRPITEGDRIRFENTLSVSGNWLGRSIVAEGTSFDVTMMHATEQWRQTSFAAFKAYANGQEGTFFVALRPLDYPKEVAYAWASDVVTASRMMPNKRVSTQVEISCQGLRQLARS
jgi:hypothetical protein